MVWYNVSASYNIAPVVLKGTTMGKSSNYPAYTNGAVTVNGNKVATVSKKGNTVTSNYNMSDLEKQMYDYAQNSLAQALPQLNIFDSNVQQGINSQLDAYRDQGMQSINDMYTPILRNLKNDMASRFGNFNNSMFMDKLGDIENNRASAISNLAQNLLIQRDNLYNNEMTRRYNYMNAMNNVQNQILNKVFDYLDAAGKNSSSGNSYNHNAYNANTANDNAAYNQNMQYAQLAMQMLPLLL